MRFALPKQLSSHIFFSSLVCWKYHPFSLNLLLLFSHYVVPNFLATPWTVTLQAPLSVEFSRQEYWSGLPFPSPGDLPDPGMEPMSSALAGEFFTTEPPGKSFSSNYLTPLWKISWPCNYGCQCSVCFFTINITHFLPNQGLVSE